MPGPWRPAVAEPSGKQPGLGRPEAWLAELQELARIGIWEWRPGSDQVLWSAEMHRIHGLAPRDGPVRQEQLRALIHPDDRDRVAAETAAGVASGRPFEMEYRIVQPGGDERAVVARCRMAGEEREPVLVGTLQDVTGSRASERQRDEVRRLHEMDRFRARFLNMAAHELKTPLTPIRIQLELLGRSLAPGSPAQQRALATLKRSVGRLSSLVDDLLDAARLQATQMRVRLRTVDVAALATEAAESYAAVAAETGVTLRVSCPGPAHAEADETRLLQVANNLLSNAVKFTPQGGTIEVRVRQEPGWVRLEVEDTGPGLSPGQAQRLFQPFVQLHGEAEAGLKGTGLGLFIVKGIVEAHGGTIAAASPGPGQGTTFTVRLPAAGEGATPAPRDPHGGLRERLRDLI
jgi:signal transduction histidine kinase